MTEPVVARDRWQRTRRGVAWGVLGLAVAYLAWQGIVRGLATSFDLTVGFAAGQAWLQGRDPYDVAVLKDVLAASSGGADTGNQLETLRNVYFPTTLPLFVPLGLVPWPMARVMALAIDTAAAGFVALGLSRALGWRFTEPRALGLIAFVLALAPLHTSIAIGQSSVVATSLIVAAILLDRSGRPVAAGLAYGLATAAKVQLGLPFLAYQFWRRRWTAAGSGSLLLVGLTLAAVLRMELVGLPWLTSWGANIDQLSGAGGINDASPLNPERYSLVNLQYLLGSLGLDRTWADVVTFAVVGAAGLTLLGLVRGTRPRQEMLTLAVIATLSLLVTYHRYYDAVLLALPIAWAVSAWQTGQRRVAAFALVLCVDFILPVQTALHEFGQRGVVPSAFTEGPVWQSILMTQHVWALVLLVVVLLLAAATVDRDEPGAAIEAAAGQPAA